MSDQRLFPVGEDNIVLTVRQKFALDQLRRAGHEGLTADEAGAYWHEERMRQLGIGHDAGVRCKFCRDTGLELLRALADRKLAHRVGRGPHWAASSPVKATGGPGELPESF